MAAKKIKKKIYIKEVSDLQKILRPNLQKMSDDITTTTFIPGLEKSKEAMDRFEKLVMLPPLPDTSIIKDFGPILDMVAAIALCAGFVMVGFAIGMLR